MSGNGAGRRRPEHLRVALIAGTLGQGGAEKQLVLMARALRQASVDVRVYALTGHEYYEPALIANGVPVVSLGPWRHPVARLGALAAVLRTHRPHVVQAGHFFTNLYAYVAGLGYRAVAFGAIRSDVEYELSTHGVWGRPLLRLPAGLLANSWRAKVTAESLGIRGDAIQVVPNVIDLDDFDHRAREAPARPVPPTGPCAAWVGHLAPVKRVDRFLRVLAAARRTVPGLHGLVIGDGPQQAASEELARDLHLLPEGVEFLGRRPDVPALLRRADLLVLTSDHEGFPNVLLEAMASHLPVVATDVGDVPRVVEDGTTGYVTAVEDEGGLAAQVARLARCAELRSQLGAAARARVEGRYAAAGLADGLLQAYRCAAIRQRNNPVLQRLETFTRGRQ